MTRVAFHTRFDGGAALDFLLIRLLPIAASFEQVIERRDDAHADTVVVQRDVPEPAVPAGGLNHHRRAFVAPGVAVGALPVGPDGALVQHRIPQAQPQAVHQQPVLAARVDDDGRADVAPRAAFGLNRDTGGSIAVEEDVDDADSLVRLHALLTRVVEHHLVELAPDHLPGLRTGVGLVVPEVERRGQLARGVHELDAVLLDETALLQFRQHVEPFEHPVRLRDQRFTDVEARKPLALEQLDAAALLGQQRGHRGAGGAASNHDNVG